MATFEMVKYHHQTYPADIPLRIEEIAAHFDVQGINPHMGYSLHTEYSYGKRRFDSALVNKYPELIDAQKDAVPQLWRSEKWAEQFAMFIKSLVGDLNEPKVIEVHSPFNDYTDLPDFISSYAVFEDIIGDKYPETEILIENRCGSVYRGGKFLFSKIKDVDLLCDAIYKNGLRLRIAYDIPQIYTAHNVRKSDDYLKLMNEAVEFRQFIGGVHLWGKRRADTGRKVSHCGDLSSYFEDDGVKDAFLGCFNDCFDDGIVRKMVLEVNSGNEDLKSIINDLVSCHVAFR